jgi:hypothetical protein
MLYPRCVAIHRVKTIAGTAGSGRTFGLTGYSGAEASTNPSDPNGEEILFTGIIASIQAAATGRKRDSTLPQDAVSNPSWTIYIPVSVLPKGSVRDRDIIVDDEQYRYEVGQAYWNVLGHKLITIRLEA